MTRTIDQPPYTHADMVVRDWHAMLAGQQPDQAGPVGGHTHDEPVRRFRDIGANIDQPALEDHVLAVHLGGPKRVTRYRGRHREVFDVVEGSATLMPAHQSFRWRTEGPVEFAHLTLSDDLLGRMALQDYDLDPNKIILRDQVGLTDTLLVALVGSLLSEAERPERARLYCDSLLCALCCHVIRHYADHAARGRVEDPASPAYGKAGGLAGWQLRRVLDYVRAHLAEDVRLADLVALTGLSRSHFFHAFGRSAGCSPHLYVTNLRVRHATALLRETDLPIAIVAAKVGLTQPQLGTAFRKRNGINPREFRRQHGLHVTSRTD